MQGVGWAGPGWAAKGWRINFRPRHLSSPRRYTYLKRSHQWEGLFQFREADHFAVERKQKRAQGISGIVWVTQYQLWPLWLPQASSPFLQVPSKFSSVPWKLSLCNRKEIPIRMEIATVLVSTFLKFMHKTIQKKLERFDWAIVPILQTWLYRFVELNIPSWWLLCYALRLRAALSMTQFVRLLWRNVEEWTISFS